jgi:hypothetical protein
VRRFTKATAMASVGVPKFITIALTIKAFIKLCRPGKPKQKIF